MSDHSPSLLKAGAAPATREPPSASALEAALDNHRRWLESRGTQGAQADLRHTDLSGGSFWRADLRRARLDGCNLSGCDLDHADLTEASLTGARLERASCWGSRLYGANLCDAMLREAKLDHADLRGADLSRADCTELSLWGALLHGADLRTAGGLSNEQLANAMGDSTTRLPDLRDE